MGANHVSLDSVGIVERQIEEMTRTAEALEQGIDLGEVLHRLAVRAKELTSAEFAAIGIFNEARQLARFVYVGIDEQVARRLGHPPVGLGLLGTLAGHDRPLRVE